jgi:acetyl-CoA carboxylase biotin carboxylase subunit
MFKKILIANRGEIAVRVIKACQEIGISSVAVFSEADRDALHVQTADEAVCIGPPPALESYLNIEKIIQTAKETGSDAIHPGYGFLAENAEFVKRCEEEKIIFIGPNSTAMALVGDKIRSRQTMEKAGIPIIPGMKGIFKDSAEYRSEAQRIGYPVMIKASAGGGGKGMRIVEDEKDLEAALESGMREAKSAFGDESVYLEKYIEDPRHIEFQVIADNYGSIVHLFERECSIQRRHQKIIEETPSQAISPELRERMGETAKKVIKITGYNNAGTVEFLLDKKRNFYFLEVNARLQVEHPITELTTGVDIVHQQISIASGEKLSLSQDELEQRGHAIECRIYAEDPLNNFLPSSGKVLFLKEPHGPGVRHDCGIYSGSEVPIFYDPILAKLIVWGDDRRMACQRMANALEEYVILGIQTTIEFLKDIIRSAPFADAKTTTGFINEYFNGWEGKKISEDSFNAALIASAFNAQSRTTGIRGDSDSPALISSPWLTLGKWRIGGGKFSGI